jgi:hypothetical protein
MKHYLSPDNKIWAYELDGSQDQLIPNNFTAITDEQVNNIRNQAIQAGTYLEKRVSEYPDIKDQLDTLYHGGYDAWKESIKTIKDKYPKS